ncbi:hypothetical protein N5E15_13380 [Pantoea stewartii]|uniref:hypothetical protein n=1 Tax=Pantoea stewartii TaxID=66269 RepID=UPI0021D4E48F|nr:hypothetical protein [Pantoea stewartii]MCU7367586.1 hypothetical protein [Pantoea stewartii]
MSDDEIYSKILEIKEDVDFFLTTISQENFRDFDVYLNNWIYLCRFSNSLASITNNSRVMDCLLSRDLLLAADLISIMRIVPVIENFFKNLSQKE